MAAGMEGGTPMICARCDQPIRPGQKYDTIVPDSMSGARPTLHVHRYGCERQQPAPISR
jgi:hypothetical protein